MTQMAYVGPAAARPLPLTLLKVDPHQLAWQTDADDALHPVVVTEAALTIKSQPGV